jgi:plasmid stability protein
MSAMRTTLTLDEDLAKELKERARRRGESFKDVVNATLRKGLQSGEKAASRLPRFEVMPKACGFRRGVDVLHLNQLNDELEMEDFQRKRSAEDSRP